MKNILWLAVKNWLSNLIFLQERLRRTVSKIKF
jgi:hypothetical protein